MAERRRRRRIIVKKGFQFKLLLLMVCAVVSTAAIIGAAIYSLTWYHLNRYLAAGPTEASFSSVFQNVNRTILLILPVMILAILLGWALYSHRIAGPLTRLGSTMRRIGRGEVPEPITFRRRDEFQDLADAFNEMLSGLKGSLSYREEVEKIRADVHRFLADSEGESAGEGDRLSFLKHVDKRLTQLGQDQERGEAS